MAQKRGEIVATLKEALMKSQEDMRLLHEQLEYATAQKEQVEEALEDLRESVKSNIPYFNDLETKNIELEKALFLKDEENKQQLEEVRTLLKKNARVKALFDDEQRQKRRAEAELAARKERLDVLRAKNQKLESKTEEIILKCERFLEIEQRCEELERENYELSQKVVLQSLHTDDRSLGPSQGNASLQK